VASALEVARRVEPRAQRSRGSQKSELAQFFAVSEESPIVEMQRQAMAKIEVGALSLIHCAPGEAWSKRKEVAA
jgi:hypothetical protein